MTYDSKRAAILAHISLRLRARRVLRWYSVAEPLILVVAVMVLVYAAVDAIARVM